MSAKPWMKFYKSSWRADASLRLCSPGARLLWLEMLLLMDDAEPCGHLLVKGKAPTIAQLGMLSGITEGETAGWLSELRAADVFSETEDGVIYSRKMVKDAKVSADQSDRRKKGWEAVKSGKTGGKTGSKPKKIEDRLPTPNGVGGARKRCPEGWMPTEADNEKLRSEGIGEFNRPSTLARFKDHEFPRKITDWSAAYRNWIRKDAEYARRNGPRLNGHDERKEAALDLLERAGNHGGQDQLRLTDGSGHSDAAGHERGGHIR